ncbi:MAG: amidase [Alphaproteobacteria bacterium]|nr:amidase [Alphaproteobacteria bacterium]
MADATEDGLALGERVRKSEVSAIELLEAAITRIEALNPELNAVVTKVYDQARDAARNQKPTGPFAGVPFLLKDLGGALGGVPFTGGSRFFKDACPPDDSVLVQRYKAAGLIPLGRTNTPEFGLNASTEPVLFGPTRNPWDTTKTSGGSSGGSAAAVAAGLVPLAHASDGGGSIRIPASCCGLFGMKTTRARNTLAPYLGESLAGCSVEHVVSRTVRDSAAALDASAGPAPGDPYMAPPQATPFLDQVKTEPRQLRIAMTTASFNGLPVHADCVAAAEQAGALCEQLGHIVEPASPEFDAERLDRDYNMLFAVGASANISQRAKALGRELDPECFERVTWAMMEKAKSLSATDYVQLLHGLHAISRDICSFFEDYDLLLTPTLAQPPVPLGHLDMMSDDLDDYTDRLWRFASFTYQFNVTGQPAISVPLSWNGDNLPIGVQFVGSYGDEATLFQLAGQLERAAPWRHRHPPIFAS